MNQNKSPLKSKHLDLIKSFSKGEQQNNEKMGSNAVIYTRVSSKDQMDNLSLETQLKGCNGFSKKLNYDVKGHFGGTYESAMSDERKEFVKMITFVKKSKEKISYIIVYSLDRFSRTGDNAIWLSRQLRELGINIVSVTQPIDTTNPSGVLQQNILFLFSQYDNDLRRQKTIEGMKEKMLRGQWMGMTPLGYKYDHIRGKEEQRIVFNNDAKLIKKAFMMKLHEGLTNIEISEAISAMGLKLTHRRLTSTFRNPFYCGYLAHTLLDGEVVKGNHPALISEEIFLLVNNILKKNAQKFGHKEENSCLPLRQFVKCASCNAPMTGYHRKKTLKNGKILNFYYYKCYTPGCKCNRSTKVVHDKFINFLKKFQLDPTLMPVIKKQLELTWNNMRQSIVGENKAMLTRLGTLRETLDKVEDRWADGEISRDIYDKRSSKLKGEIEEIVEELEKSQVNISNPSELIDKGVKIASDLANLWVSGDYEERKTVQEILFPEGVVFDKENDSFRTSKINFVVSLIANMSMDYTGKNKRQASEFLNLSPSVVRTGIEPVLPE
jgi:site-specific DNA recombinase